MNAIRLKFTVLPQVWHDVRPFDCEDDSEPCPLPDCKYRIDNPAHPEVTCAIDVAEDGPMTQQQVADVLGVSQERVLFIEKRALRKLRAGGLYRG